MLSSGRFRTAILAAVAVTAVAARLSDGVPSALAQEPAGKAAPETTPPIATQSQMETAFDEYDKVGLDLERPLEIHGLVLKRDTMELTFASGTVYLAQPISGRVTGACFLGSATIRVTLPNPIDRKLLKSVYGRPDFEETLNAVVLRFDDGTERDILAAGKPASSPGPDPASLWSDRLKIQYNAIDRQMDFLDDVVDGFKSTTFFDADLRTADGKDWYSYTHSGRSRIEDGLYHERAIGAAGKRWYSVLSDFHRPQDYDAKGNYDVMPASDAKEVAALRNVAMTVEIPNTKSVAVDARLTVEALRDGVAAIRFGLLNNLGGAWYEKGRPVNVGLVADSQGNPLPFLHRWNQLLVLLPKPLARGQKAEIHVQATEDTIIQLTDKSFWIFTDSPWFPQIGHLGGRYTMDWTLKVAKPMRAAGSGDTVREWEEGAFNCTQWKSDIPVMLASFIFGDLKPTDGTYKREPPGTGQVGLRLYTVYGGSFHFMGKPENVLFNITQGIKTYETIFGPLPFAQLDVAEIAPQIPFAQSPAGILLLPSTLAGTSGGGGEADQVIFHELAHQWWGQQVGWVGPEDDWISESWAEYAAGLMTEGIDRKRFHTKLEGWKKFALEADKYGTIATAYRSDSVDYGAAREHLLYDKGPYVVHMLRTWMGWEKFSRYVGAIQSKYKGTDINTDTLAREAGAVMGYDMFPFFDQWVRDRGIPRVHWSWSAAADADGKQVVTIRVRQEDPEHFKLLMVPITFDFGKADPVIVPKPILKAETEIQVKVPTVPKAVRMDDDETQLAIFISDGKDH
jgi:hypothetical protein